MAGRYEGRSEEGRPAAAELSDDMCCQSAEVLPEVSAQASQLSLEEEFRESVSFARVSFAADDVCETADDAKAFLREREREREEHMQEVEERERDIERAAEAAWEQERGAAGEAASDDDQRAGDEEDTPNAGEEGGVDGDGHEPEEEEGEEEEDEEEEEEEDDDGEDDGEDEDGAQDAEAEGLRDAATLGGIAPVDLSLTSAANHSFDMATENLDAFEFVKIAPRSPQGYDPRQHPLILVETNRAGEATFAVTAMTETGAAIEPFASPPRDTRSPVDDAAEGESRPQTGFTDMSTEDSPRGDEPLSPIIKGEATDRLRARALSCRTCRCFCPPPGGLPAPRTAKNGSF